MNLVLKATRFADQKHSGQKRKATGVDYITHPIAVSYIVAAFKRSRHIEEILAACLLHDVLEDTDTTFEELAREFTPLVATLVFELTNDTAQILELGKLEYQKRKMLGISSYALVIKLADRLHNMRDNPSQQMVQDTSALMWFLRRNRRLSKTQEALIEEIEAVCGEHLYQEKRGGA